RRQDRDEDQDEDEDGVKGVTDHSGRKGRDGHDEPDFTPGRHPRTARERLVEGHLREPGGDEAPHGLRDDRDYAQDDRERDQSHVGGDGREVHLNPEGDEENGRENGPQISRSLGEVVLERLVREQGSREEGAANRREAYRLRGGSEQARDRQRDAAPTGPETHLLSLHVKS